MVRRRLSLGAWSVIPDCDAAPQHRKPTAIMLGCHAGPASAAGTASGLFGLRWFQWFQCRFQDWRPACERIAVTTPLPDQPFTDFPTVTPATLATEVPNWIYLRRAQVEGLARLLTPRSDFDKETMEALGRKLRAMESRITRGDAHATVVADFKAWIVVDSNDGGAWDYYKAWQQKHDGEVADAQQREAAAKAVSQARGRAGDAAAAQTRTRPTGLMASDGVNGRVIAGLALVGAPALSYFGISGTDMHAASSAAVDLVITELLKGTNQAEK
jgi:hypothetical protein